jgi:hypothetical protein
LTTQNTNFKVKNGLDVSGTATATTFTVSGVGNLEVLPSKTGNSGKFLTTDGTSLSWATGAGGGGGSSVTVSESPPESPTVGDMWFESDSTRMFVYYDNFWVEASSPVAAIGQLDGGLANSTYGGIAPIDAGEVL